MIPEPSFTVWTILFLIAAAQGIFLSLLLGINNRGNIKSNKIMAVFTVAFSLTLTYYVLFWTGFSCNFMWTKGWCSALPFLFGPLMYLYLMNIKNGELPAKYSLHFIPFAVHFTYMITFIYWFTAGPDAIAQSNLPLNMYLHDKIYRHTDTVIFSFKVFNSIQFFSLLAYSVLLIRFLLKEKKDTNRQDVKHRWYFKNILCYTLFAVSFSFYW
ncbi:MAG: hypothetical protein H7Y00_04715, partial [Fimbriimonadaceae bacterium]|nr:hypothetical protein [Chitinophagales bacterium]